MEQPISDDDDHKKESGTITEKIKCKGCQEGFERIFGHLRYNPNCKIKYTSEEIENLKEKKKEDKRPKRQLSNAKQYAKMKRTKIMVNNISFRYWHNQTKNIFSITLSIEFRQVR